MQGAGSGAAAAVPAHHQCFLGCPQASRCHAAAAPRGTAAPRRASGSRSGSACSRSTFTSRRAGGQVGGCLAGRQRGEARGGQSVQGLHGAVACGGQPALCCMRPPCPPTARRHARPLVARFSHPRHVQGVDCGEVTLLVHVRPCEGLVRQASPREGKLTLAVNRVLVGTYNHCQTARPKGACRLLMCRLPMCFLARRWTAPLRSGLPRRRWPTRLRWAD